MKTTRTSGRAMALALFSTMFIGFAPATASACDHDYTVRPGDTLSAIAANCGLTVAALTEANKVDPYRLKIGDVLSIPGSVTSRDSAKRSAPTGPTAEEIAEYRAMRDAHPDARIAVSEGEWRNSIDIAGEGYAPGEIVRIAISGRDGEWVTLGDAPADDEGRYDVRARIPADLVRSGVLRVAAERPWGEIAGAEYEHNVVVAKRAPENGRIVSVNGRVISGGECDLLMTRNGSYALTGGTSAIEPGATVRVVGVRQEGGAADCVGGRAAIHVSAVQRL